MINSCGEMDEPDRDRIVDTCKMDRQEEDASLVGLGRELANTDTIGRDWRCTGPRIVACQRDCPLLASS
jgi:hypothetical protein